MQFDQGVLRATAAQFAPTKSLLECSELQFNSPSQTVELPGLLPRQFILRQDVRYQVEFATWALKFEEPQDDGRLLFARYLIRPEINQTAMLSRGAEVLQEPNIGPDPNKEALPLI